MSTILTIPNILTFMRMGLIPVFVSLVYYGYSKWALAVFLIAGVSDGIDGFLARDLDDDTRAFLVEMRAVHLRNIRRCDELLVELDRQREVQVDRGYDEGESPEGGTT